MTGDELIQLIKSETSAQFPNSAFMESTKNKSIEQKYIYGLKGIAKLFGCSISSARRLKKVERSMMLLFKTEGKSLWKLIKHCIWLKTTKSEDGKFPLF